MAAFPVYRNALTAFLRYRNALTAFLVGFGVELFILPCELPTPARAHRISVVHAGRKRRSRFAWPRNAAMSAGTAAPILNALRQSRIDVKPIRQTQSRIGVKPIRQTWWRIPGSNR